jgi:hypothetical protein
LRSRLGQGIQPAVIDSKLLFHCVVEDTALDRWNKQKAPGGGRPGKQDFHLERLVGSRSRRNSQPDSHGTEGGCGFDPGGNGAIEEIQGAARGEEIPSQVRHIASVPDCHGKPSFRQSVWRRRRSQWLPSQVGFSHCVIRSEYEAAKSIRSRTRSCDAFSELAFRLGRLGISKSALVRETIEREMRNGGALEEIPSIYDLAREDCGCFDNGLTDLATNPKYMDDF